MGLNSVVSELFLSKEIFCFLGSSNNRNFQMWRKKIMKNSNKKGQKCWWTKAKVSNMRIKCLWEVCPQQFHCTGKSKIFRFNKSTYFLQFDWCFRILICRHRQYIPKCNVRSETVMLNIRLRNLKFQKA
jgi:hypothetical protein